MSILGALWIRRADARHHTRRLSWRACAKRCVRHVLVGLVKAPAFAFFIALIGTRMGMTVGRDTRAVGLATTSTVVQSIVAVILLDAAFAVIFQRLGI